MPRSSPLTPSTSRPQSEAWLWGSHSSRYPGPLLLTMVDPPESNPDPSCCPHSPLRPVSYSRIQGTRAAPSLTSTVTMSLALNTTWTPLPVSVAWREGGMGRWGVLSGTPCPSACAPPTESCLNLELQFTPFQLCHAEYVSRGCDTVGWRGPSKCNSKPARRQSD